MSISSAQYAVDGTALKLAESNGMPLEVHLHCASGSIYVGNSSVTTLTGFRMDNGDKAVFTVPDGSALYAISASGSQTVYALVAVL